ncbi:hypothetical protein [Paenibacillus aceti]|uniref:Uncharacterized protein n=1 Tax=Paenibacillus aceti TaxID=1820010 RepID=A0ABQ1W1H0_9BACL|nr:hypothetical protein [Paenibacillus aceti]GGG08705.1 hypothetical protein GCM10010913_33090 [Paenibacillus aceti]
MKKLVYSLVASIVLVGSLTAVVSAATSSLIGKKVQGVIAVTVNGKAVKDAVVIDGTTYAPVRSFSEASGYTVKVEKGEVQLTMPETINRTEEEVVKELKVKDQINTLRNNIVFWQATIDGNKETIKQAESAIERAEAWNKEAGEDVIKMDTSGAEEKLKKAQDEIADIQAKITAAEAEIAKLEAQLGK